MSNNCLYSEDVEKVRLYAILQSYDRKPLDKEGIQCRGKMYSEEHRRKFDIKNDILRIEKSSVDDNKLALTTNRQAIAEWFKNNGKC